MTPDERIAELEAETARLRADNAALRAQVEALLGRIVELEARVAKDSHTSHKPPSSDPLGRKRPRSQRRKSGKKPGGQLGHRGETLHLVAAPDEVVEHRLSHCPNCQTPLAVRLVVREQQALHVRCPTCAHLTVGVFPAEAPSRAQYGAQARALAVYLVEHHHLPLGRVQQLLSDLWRMRLGRGTLVRWIQQAARALQPVEQHIKTAGFYRNKARNIQSCCRVLVENHDGEVPKTMEELIELGGVGRKTANVVLGNAFNINIGVVVDTHIARLSMRLDLTREKDPVKIELALMPLIPREQWTLFSHLLIWHGRRRCSARNPDCANCEVQSLCPRIGVKPKRCSIYKAKSRPPAARNFGSSMCANVL
jgi:endonuclease-3